MPKNNREIILVKCGELVLKGLNRSLFERRLIANIRRRLSPIGRFAITTAQSTIFISQKDEYDPVINRQAVDVLRRVYGIAAIARAIELPKDIAAVEAAAPGYCAAALTAARTFKVEARRSDKRFGMTSPQIMSHIGGILQQAYPHLTVDVHKPEVTVFVEIRDAAAYVHAGAIPGAGGLPVGTGGSMLLLLSGGIDSPVAGSRIIRRGVELSCLHFDAPPYTSPRALQKVRDLAAVLSEIGGTIRLYTAHIAEVQEILRSHVPEPLFTLCLRRFMMRVACLLSQREGFSALVTGDNLGQVASQTAEAIAAVDAAADRPILRPLVGYDKEEIIREARLLGTMELSSLPYDDCCTLFVPKHPKTKPSAAELAAAEEGLDMSALLAGVMNEMGVDVIK